MHQSVIPIKVMVHPSITESENLSNAYKVCFAAQTFDMQHISKLYSALLPEEGQLVCVVF